MEKIITKNQVIHTIGAKLEKEFSANGFKYIKSKKDLIRKNKDGFDRIIFNTYNSYPISHQKLSIGFQKRINLVEEVVNQFYDERFMNTEFHKTTVTVYSDNELLKEFYDNEFKSENSADCLICTQIKDLEKNGFILHTESDIENIASLLVVFIRDKVLPFFDVNNDLNYVNESEKKEMIEVFELKGWIDPISFMRSLVLMKLTKDTSYQVVKNEYIDRMIVPANPDVHALKIEAVKELITYLESKEF
ncbi:hypothetical protein [Tenacibaculum ovolyticum]|uniref:hypothetical protein n=1 Tax=Tenacibaculum ovolyticum TaxID=104270 RepID=UPI0003F752CE|nr:hypothetical protein [Tenacibaculum ovolyticum]